MDKIKELGDRVEKLEERLRKNYMNDVKVDTAFVRMVSPELDQRVDVLEKYSRPNLPDKFEELDLGEAIEEANSMNNSSLKLEYWTNYFLRLFSKFESEDDWYEYQFLYVFSLRAKEYYERKIIERLLKEGGYYKGQGNQHYYDPKKTVEWWDELSKNEEYLNNGEPIKGKIYDEIRKRHNPNDPNQENGVPANPCRKTIRTHLQKAGRV